MTATMDAAARPMDEITIELMAADGTRRPVTVSAAAPIEVTAHTEVPGLLDLEVSGHAPVTIRCAWPAGDAVTIWRPDSASRRDLPGDWGAGRAVGSTKWAPVASLVGASDRSRLTASLSASVRACDMALAINEETAQAVLQVRVRDVDAEDGRFHCRIDVRDQHFARALRQVASWWQAEMGEHVATVPEVARRPMYSTWYSNHQSVTDAVVEAHAHASVPFGCRAIIVDDGWQTDDTARGYAFCGDWQPTGSAFRDMAAHVARVHEAGMAYLLWVAAPFVGKHAQAWQAMQPYVLAFNEGLGASVLDPRFPEVRASIVEHCVRPVREWGVDGLKLDFIDSWYAPHAPVRPGMDCNTVEEGVERLLADITEQCRALRGDVLIEFRQDYVSPRLWPYGTIIRATDCPLDPVENRVRTIDLRLLAGDRAIHSDMLLWHASATPEEVAAQFIAILFSVPQISVDLAALSPQHEAVVRHWLGFMDVHQDVLQHGELLPSRPDARYTKVAAVADGKEVVVAYTDGVVDVSADRRLVLVNGTPRAALILRTVTNLHCRLVITDCAGRETLRTETVLAAGVAEIAVPVGGTITVTPAEEAIR